MASPLNDDWDDWESQPEPNNTSEDDDYAWVGSTTQASSDFEDDWGEQPMPTSTPSEDNYIWDDSSSQDNSGFEGGTGQFDGWQGGSQIQDTGNINDIDDFSGATTPTNRFNLSMKQAGVVIAGGFIVLALVLYFISNININKKPRQSNQVPTQQTQQQPVQQTQQQPMQQTEAQPTQQPVSKSDVALVNVPNNTQVDYSGKIYEATGSVTNKSRYLTNNQLVYLIQVEIPFGSESMVVNYFCGYNVYNSVNSGDVVTVNYQQVSDTCFSVNTLIK